MIRVVLFAIAMVNTALGIFAFAGAEQISMVMSFSYAAAAVAASMMLSYGESLLQKRRMSRRLRGLS